MKTQLLYKAVFMLLLIPTMVLGSNGLNGKHTKEKTIKKDELRAIFEIRKNKKNTLLLNIFLFQLIIV